MNNNIKKHVLYISMITPSKSIGHAGGKTFYYYFKNVQDSSEYQVDLISKKEKGQVVDTADLNNARIFTVESPKVSIKNWKILAPDLFSKINPFRKYGNTIRYSVYHEMLKAVKKIDDPDTVVLEFTEMVLLAPEIRRIFPNAKIFASEHDVSFLGLERRYKNEKNVIKRLIKKTKYIIRKKYELRALTYCDYVMPHNDKDRKLLLSNGIPDKKIFVLTPYFEKFHISRTANSKNIIFYGAMNRTENIEAATWFAKKVMPYLEKYRLKFYIIGSKPSKEILELASENVVVTGFVDSVKPFFENALCAVCPLFNGAGIKVKNMETLAAGVPLLTNEIGIEGIYAVNGKDYIKCTTSYEYVEAIKKLINGEINAQELSENAIKMMNDNYNLEKSLMNYKNLISK